MPLFSSCALCTPGTSLFLGPVEWKWGSHIWASQWELFWETFFFHALPGYRGLWYSHNSKFQMVPGRILSQAALQILCPVGSRCVHLLTIISVNVGFLKWVQGWEHSWDISSFWVVSGPGQYQLCAEMETRYKILFLNYNFASKYNRMTVFWCYFNFLLFCLLCYFLSLSKW